MIRIWFFLSLILFSQAKAAIEEVYLQPSRDSFLLSAMLDHIKETPTDALTEQKILDILEKIDVNLARTPQENFLLLIDTEITKAFLNYKSTETVSDISGAQIVLAKKKLERDEAKYNRLIKSLYGRILIDYEPFVQSRAIFNLKNPKFRDLISEKDRMRINLLNKYLGEKIYAFNERQKPELMKYIQKLCLYALKNLELASYAYEFNTPDQAVRAPIFTGLSKARESLKAKKEKNTTTTLPPAAIIEKLDDNSDTNQDSTQRTSSKIDELIEDVSPNNN